MKIRAKVIRPLSVLLLDFQMPIKNGIQAIIELRKFYKYIIDNEDDIVVIEPTYVILTSFATPGFKQHLKEVKIEHCYEKPLQLT